MKKLTLALVLAIILMAVPALAIPSLQLSNDAGYTTIAQLGNNPSTIDAASNATLVLYDWASQSARKQYIQKQIGQPQFWEGAVMSIFGSDVGVLVPQPIELSWLISDSSTTLWQMFIKPYNDVSFQEVDISQPGSINLWAGTANNAWMIAISVTNVAPVPEPSGFLALLGGVGGLIGFALKRRA